eukprot:scaffold332859_cov43-Prasinocladus_malaysianus.AAC.1
MGCGTSGVTELENAFAKIIKDEYAQEEDEVTCDNFVGLRPPTVTQWAPTDPFDQLRCDVIHHHSAKDQTPADLETCPAAAEGPVFLPGEGGVEVESSSGADTAKTIEAQLGTLNQMSCTSFLRNWVDS